MNEGISRRELLIDAGCIVGMIGVGGVAAAFVGKDDLLRPPGAQNEKFLGACIKCDRCRTVCPLDCVTFATLNDGILQARTPILDFHQGYCDFCNKCIEACPTGALKAFDPLREKIGIALIDPDTCLAYTRGACKLCYDACDFDAVIFDEKGTPHINVDACNGCGACVYECPSNVFGAFGGRHQRAIEVVVYEGGM